MTGSSCAKVLSRLGRYVESEPVIWELLVEGLAPPLVAPTAPGRLPLWGGDWGEGGGRKAGTGSGTARSPRSFVTWAPACVLLPCAKSNRPGVSEVLDEYRAHAYRNPKGEASPPAPASSCASRSATAPLASGKATSLSNGRSGCPVPPARLCWAPPCLLYALATQGDAARALTEAASPHQ